MDEYYYNEENLKKMCEELNLSMSIMELIEEIEDICRFDSIDDDDYVD